MANQVKVVWSPAGTNVLAGDFTLSRGITPSVINLTCVPFEGQIPAVSDVTFQDGGTVLTFKDCGYAGPSKSRSGGGTVWTIQLYDGRWRWKYGVFVGHYNELINRGWLSVTDQGEVPADERELTKSARDLAKMLLKDELAVADFDVDALPAGDFPEVTWDHIRPAQCLAELVDLYGLAICFDPVTGRVEIVKPGEGEDLPIDATLLSDDLADAEKIKPKTIKAICGRTAHEEEFELEAVGLDTDGQIKVLADLSYKPTGGWESDYLLLSGVPDDSVTDPRDPGKTTTKRKLAEECVFRWYRIKSQTNWKINGWLKDGAPRVTLARLLPIQAEVLEPYAYTQNGKVYTKRQAGSVRGVHASDWKGMGQTNTAATVTVAESFSVDEATGVVEFSQPVFAWDSNLPVAATLYLRCVVYGDRYVAKEKAIGGASGIEGIDCSHLVVKYKDGAAQNKADVDAAAAVILAAVAKGYEARETGSRSYAGIKDFELDGKCPQITWTIGPGGATTEASQESEHNPWVPSEANRRLMELQAVPTYRDEEEF